MRKPSLDKIIEANKNKTGHIPNKGNISLSTNGWLNQYKMGGGMFPEYHSYAPPRLQGGGSGDAAVLQQQKNGESIGWLDKYQNAGQVVNNFGLANPRDLARQNMGSNESTSSGFTMYKQPEGMPINREAKEKAYRTIRPSEETDLKNYTRWLTNTTRTQFDEPRSEEAWRMYLGVPGPNQYFSSSNTRPSYGDKSYKNYYKADNQLEQDIFNTFKDDIKPGESRIVDESDVTSNWGPDDNVTNDGYLIIQPGDENKIFGRPAKSRARALGHFTINRGADDKGDYISYQDIYDFPDWIQSRTKGIPFDIYNRIYYPKVDNKKQKKKEGGMITDPRGQWAHPGQNTRIPGNNITMQGVPYPVLGKANNGMTTMMYPGQDYSFPGASHVDEYPMMEEGGWLDKYQKGGTLPKAQKGKRTPVYVNNPNDPRLKLYSDSASVFKASQNPFIWEGTKPTSKEDYEKKRALQDKMPRWSFDEDQYKKDKKAKKFKDFNDYMYDVGLVDKKDPKALDAYNRNIGKHYQDLDKPIEQKLPDGRIKQFWTKYDGKLDTDHYDIYDPVTGSQSMYGADNTFIQLYNPNIKPIGHKYYAFDKPFSTGETYISSEDSEYVNKVLKNKTKNKKNYSNYTYGANDNEVYKEPVQPVIYNKKKYNPNDPRLQQLQESFNRFHSGIKGKSKEKSKEQPKSTPKFIPTSDPRGHMEGDIWVENKPEPKLRGKKVTHVDIISGDKPTTPGITELQHPDVQIPPIQQGKYRVEYFDPSLKEETHRMFMTQAESDAYADELSKRNLTGVPSAGNITQRVQYKFGGSELKNGGWLEKYQYAGTVIPGVTDFKMPRAVSDNANSIIYRPNGAKTLGSNPNPVVGPVRGQEGTGETIINTTGKILDPTGISSWGDAGVAIGEAMDDPSLINVLGAGMETLGALPLVHYLGAAAKLPKTVNALSKAEKTTKLKKVLKGVGTTAKWVSGEPIIAKLDKITGAADAMSDANKFLVGVNRSNRFINNVVKPAVIKYYSTQAKKSQDLQSTPNKYLTFKRPDGSTFTVDATDTNKVNEIRDAITSMNADSTFNVETEFLPTWAAPAKKKNGGEAWLNKYL